MNYQKLYKLARINVKISTALEKCGNDSRKLPKRARQLYTLAERFQRRLTREERRLAIKMIGEINGLRLEVANITRKRLKSMEMAMSRDSEKNAMGCLLMLILLPITNPNKRVCIDTSLALVSCSFGSNGNWTMARLWISSFGSHVYL